MKDFGTDIQYKGETFRLVFNLNVMEDIQEEYGTIDRWGELTDGQDGEPNAKAIIYGFRAMLNEGIDMDNEENGKDKPFLSLKQVGRIVSEIGLMNATEALNDTVVESTQSDEKNA